MSGKRDDDAAVTQAYLRRVMGYEVTEVKKEYKVNEEGELELLKKTEKTKHVPGDPRAAEFWLANRCPDKWRAIRQLVSGGPEDGEETGLVEIPCVEELEGPGESRDGASAPLRRGGSADPEHHDRRGPHRADRPDGEGSGSGRAANGSMTDQEGSDGS